MYFLIRVSGEVRSYAQVTSGLKSDHFDQATISKDLSNLHRFRGTRKFQSFFIETYMGDQINCGKILATYFRCDFKSGVLPTCGVSCCKLSN